MVQWHQFHGTKRLPLLWLVLGEFTYEGERRYGMTPTYNPITANAACRPARS